MDLTAKILLAWGVSLFVCLLIAMAGHLMLRRDALRVFFWGAIFGPLGSLVALMLMPAVDQPEEDGAPPAPRKRSADHERRLAEAARRSGIR